MVAFLKRKNQEIFGEFHHVWSYLALWGETLDKVEPYKGISLNRVTRAPRSRR
jgi:hypothetical protein